MLLLLLFVAASAAPKPVLSDDAKPVSPVMNILGVHRPVYLYNLGVFCTPKNVHTLHLATPHCLSVSFCIALCAVSALNSRGLYFHCKVREITKKKFLLETFNYFQIIFTEIQTKQKRGENTQTCLKTAKNIC